MTFKKLDNNDILILSIFAVLVLVKAFFAYIPLIPPGNVPMDEVIYELILSFIAVFIIATTPFPIRFRNGYFAMFWALISLAYILTDMRPITVTPLFLYILFLFFRFVFGKIYQREFIPCTLSKSRSYGYFSKIDNRQSDKHDAVFMRIYFFAAFLAMLASFYLSGTRS